MSLVLMEGMSMSYHGKLASEEAVGLCSKCGIGVVTLKIFERKVFAKRILKRGVVVKETIIRRRYCQCQNPKCKRWHDPRLFWK